MALACTPREARGPCQEGKLSTPWVHLPRAAFTFVTLFFAYASTGTGTQGWVTISVAGVSCPCVLASPLVYTDSTGKTWTVATSPNGTDMLVSSNFAGGSSASKGISLSQGSLLWLQLQFDAIPVGAAQVGWTATAPSAVALQAITFSFPVFSVTESCTVLQAGVVDSDPTYTRSVVDIERVDWDFASAGVDLDAVGTCSSTGSYCWRSPVMSEQVFASNDCVVTSVTTGQNALVTLYFSARSPSSYLLSDWCPVLVSCKAGDGVGAYVPLKTTMAAPMVFRNWTLSCTADGYLLARITSLWPPQSLLWVQLGVNAAGSSLLSIECPCSFVGLNAGMQTILTSPTLDSLAAAPYNAVPRVQVFAAGLQDLGTAVDLSDGGAYSFYACASGLHDSVWHA